MTFFLEQSRFSFRSTTDAGKVYTYDIVVYQNGQISVDAVMGPNGPAMYTGGIPSPINDDIQQAILQAQGLVMSTSAFNGTVTFNDNTAEVVTFNTPMASTNYRVYLDSPSFIGAWVTSKSTTSFTITTSVTYTGSIGFDVFE